MKIIQNIRRSPMIFLLILSLLLTTVSFSSKAENDEGNIYNNFYSFVDEYGHIIDCVVEEDSVNCIAKIYDNKVLIQSSRFNFKENTMYNQIYDGETDISSYSSEPEINQDNGYKQITTHLEKSDERLDDTITPLSSQSEPVTESTDITARALINEPVDNTGLSPSWYGDGYYHLGDAAYYNPSIKGELFRKYTTRYLGETKYHKWLKGEPLSELAAWLTLIKSATPVEALLNILVYTTKKICSYDQAIYAETIGFDYTYCVRVNQSVYFSTNRYSSYWKFKNDTINKVTWDQKQFLGGFGANNHEMTKAGVDEYIFGKPILTYQSHVQNIGWQAVKAEGDLSGTEGKDLRMEGIKIHLNCNRSIKGSIQYQAQIENIGWQNWVSNGGFAGTTGRGLRLEALKIQLTGEAAQRYDIVYRAHVQNDGWQNWARNGQIAGTVGQGKRLEAIEIKLLRK